MSNWWPFVLVLKPFLFKVHFATRKNNVPNDFQYLHFHEQEVIMSDQNLISTIEFELQFFFNIKNEGKSPSGEEIGVLSEV
jgi:hypothetical protein